MNNNTTTTPPSFLNRDWLDILLPVLGFGILFLLFILFFNYFIISCYRCTCFTKLKNFCFGDSRTRDSGHVNPDLIHDDLPPTYSVAGIGRSSVEIFQVLPVDVSDVSRIHRTESSLSEKLPSYLEIMEDKKKKESARSSSEQSESNKENESSSQSEHSKDSDNERVRSPHAALENSSEDEISVNPPPYSAVSS